jgi:hypothetical protein
VDLIRQLVTTRFTLAHTFFVGSVPTDATGPVTVTVKRLDGTAVTSGAAAGLGSGVYTFEVDEQPAVDTLTVDWSGSLGGAAITVRDVVEIVGGFVFGLAEARSAHATLASTTTYPDAVLAGKRTGVEQEAERIAGRAFVPRFARFLLDGSGTSELVVPDMDLRAVRAAATAARAGGTFTTLSVDQLAAVAPLPEGVLARDDGATWPRGRRNVLVEYEHGLGIPPVTVKDAAILRLRSYIAAARSAIPERAVSFTVTEGGIYRLAAAGPHSTGWPEVDAAYKGEGHPKVWLAS